MTETATTDYATLLDAAREKIAEQQELLKQLTGDPWGLATVVAESEHDGEPTFVVADASGICEVLAPKDMEVEPGDKVRINAETHAIVSASETEGHGGIAVVSKCYEDLIEAEMDGQTRMVHRGKISPEKGERIVLDFTGTVAIDNLGRDEERFRFDATSGVGWDDIGGLEEIKAEMIQAIETPHRHPELYEFYNKKPVAGVLLYGPPGTGKTLIGKATATALANIFGKSNGGFFYVKGPEILNEYVGRSEATIRQLFERARRFKAEHGHPAVVFIDEADAVLGRRGTGISSDMEKTIVPMFLTEMDGLEASGALVILATNRQDTLDPAVVREGRIDRHMRVTRPNEAATKDIFELYLGKVPIAGAEASELAQIATDALFHESKAFGKIQTKAGLKIFTMGHIVHGGMIENIVDQATSVAISRDLEKPRGKKGIKKEDVLDAVERVFVQNRHLDHKDALNEMLEGVNG